MNGEESYINTLINENQDHSYDFFSICEWLNLETNIRIAEFDDDKEEDNEQQEREEGVSSEPQHSKNSKMVKRKRGRPSTRPNREGPRSFKKFAVNGKTYVWFGNTCVEVGTEKYHWKRTESCLAVKRCRLKKEQEYKEVFEQLKQLTEENQQLVGKLETLTKEVDNLKEIVKRRFSF